MPPRIGVRAVDGGALSPWLVRELRTGDLLDVAPPAGSFTADLTVPDRHVMIAAGSGITPVLSIAATALRAGAEVTVIYGNRRADTVMFAEELADLKDAHPQRFALVHVLSREPRDAEILSGRLDADRVRRLVTALTDLPTVRHWWLCGPYPMVQEIRGVLTTAGVPADRVHRELFYVEDTAPAPVAHADRVSTGPTAQVTIVLDGRRTTLALAADTPILDAAQLVRADLPFACKGGVCGTCRARVTTGAVRMRRNFALEPAELDAGYVLTCQSIPTSPDVTVDYDI